MKFKYNGHSRKSGVYRITNLTNGKFYIGSCAEFKRRSTQHRSHLRGNKHSNKHLQNAWNKYGEESFLFEVVEVIPGDRTARTTREQELIDEQLKADNRKGCYNVSKKAVSAEREYWSKDRNGFSEEHKRKISKSLKAFYRTNPEAAKKAGERIVKARPAESAAKIYETHLIAPDGKEYRKIRNLAKFCRRHDLSSEHLSQVLFGDRVHHKGWVLKKNEELSGVTKIPMSEKTKRKIAKANTGQKRSKKTREKLRLQKLGDKNPISVSQCQRTRNKRY